ncbi:MAG: type IV pilus modification PilV family protein [Phycisphaerales bacterium]
MTVRSTPAQRKSRGGFTLLETALATVIIGVGVLAMVEAQATFSRSNDFSTSAATGNYLANELRERMRNLPRHDPVTGLYFRTVNGANSLVGWGPETGELTQGDFDDLDDFDGAEFGAGETFAGPISSRGDVLSELGADGSPILDDQSEPVSLRGWVQRVVVEKVDPQNFSTVRDDSYVRAAVPPNFPGLGVERFPLRVTIIVSYQSPLDTHPQEMGRVVFIAP